MKQKETPARNFKAALWGALVLFSLTNCQTTTRHQFLPPAQDWQIKTGQLQYHGPKTTLIGEVLVRFSQSGDLELTFTKGPGVTLLMLRQDANFARIEGPLARGRWSGPIEHAPHRLRGWLALRPLLLQSSKPMIKSTTGMESFVFQF